ncbi:hypothetical protein B0H14DRAFT_2666495 [Mycena olivaceomarginata]|nr:hypothetical protein B0H14DRAFT_2666495 [Mycena olivaceomarginata]
MPISQSHSQPPPPQPPTSSSMVFCSHCGTSGEGRFCTECGTRLISAGASGGASTSQIAHEPPPYDPYSSESPTSAAPSAGGSTSGGTVTQSNVRGVAGSPAVTSGGTSAPQTASAGFVSPPAMNAPALYQQTDSPTALFGSQGYRLDAFHHIAREIFVALDRSTYPIATQMMEASKIRRFRELSGKSIPPYYETHVLPMYCAYRPPPLLCNDDASIDTMTRARQTKPSARSASARTCCRGRAGTRSSRTRSSQARMRCSRRSARRCAGSTCSCRGRFCARIFRRTRIRMRQRASCSSSRASGTWRARRLGGGRSTPLWVAIIGLGGA